MKLVKAFALDCNPPKSTSQQKGIMMIGGKPRHFKKKKVAEAENTLVALLAEFRTETAAEGPLYLEVHWMYPWRAAETKKAKALGFKWSDKRPDCSNIIKMFEDCMTALAFWNDDSQIADLRVKKYWCDKPGIKVLIYQLEETDKP